MIDKATNAVKIIAFLCLLISLALGSPSLSRAQSVPQTTGIFAINSYSPSGVISSSILADQFIKGILVVVGWKQIERAEGLYDWSLVDKIINQAAANQKEVVLGIRAGYETPQWVYTDGARSFQFLWDKTGFGPALCSVQSIPVPWDPTFLQKWQTFVQALGAHYSSNTTVVSVMLYGVSFHSVEVSLPVTVGQPISSKTTSCIGYNYPVLWQAAGYTRAKVESALSQMQSTFQSAFPSTQLLAGLSPGGFPPIDQDGNLIAGRPVDAQVPSDLVASGASTLGPQFSGGDGGLTAAGWTWDLLTDSATTLNTGYQTNAALGSKLPAAITAALDAGARWIQLYPTDLLLPANQSAIINAAAALQ